MSPKFKIAKSKGKSSAPGEPQLRHERELRRIADTVLRIAKVRGVPETEVHVEEVIDALTRFANNTIHQNVAEHGVTVSIRTVLDGRTARLTTNRVDQDSLRAAVEDCLSLASSQPKDPNLLPLLGKQNYRKVNRFTSATATFSAEDRARAVKRTCDLADKSGQVAAGIFSSGQTQTLQANSRGLLATHRQTQSEFSVTMQQGSAASWAKANAADVRQIDPVSLAKIASEKVARAQDPIELAPGNYTVILEPAAVLDLIGFLFYDFSATAVSDKRSCFSGRLGKQLLGKNITITDDVYHPEQLGPAFDGEGLPRHRVTLVDQGVNQKPRLFAPLRQKGQNQTHRTRFCVAQRIRRSAHEPGRGRREFLPPGDDCLHRSRPPGHPSVVYPRSRPLRKGYDWHDARWIVPRGERESW